MYHAQFQIYSFEEDIPVGVYRGLFLRFVNLRFGTKLPKLAISRLYKYGIIKPEERKSIDLVGGIMVSIGAKLRDERKKKGLTQQQLADKIGSDVRWVQKIESGEILLENVTFSRGIALLRTLYEGTDDPQIEKVWFSLNSVYILLRELMRFE